MNDALVVIAALVALMVAVGLLIGIIFSAVQHPGRWLCGLVLLVLIISCQRADAAERFDVSVVIETVDDLDAANQAVSYAAGIFGPQVGIEVVAVQVQVGSIAEGTTHAQTLLDAVKVYRFAKGYEATSDATVLLTRRTLTRGYQGIATIGPACSASAAAVVTLRGDGYDGQILAHELGHTLGLMHDAAPGWLMSDSLGRAGSDTFSPDSLDSLKAAPLGCMLAGGPPSATQTSMVGGAAAPDVPAGTSGGGGSFDWRWLAVLFALLGFVYVVRGYEKMIRELRELVLELEAFKPPPFALVDIVGNPTPDVDDEARKRYLHIEFTSLGGLVEFNTWLYNARNRYKREGWPAVES